MHTSDYKLEVPDKTPVEMPLGYERPESLESMIARMVRNFSVVAEAEGAETFEESDDFDTDDDSELSSAYQLTDMQEETPNGYHLKPNNQKRRATDRTETPSESTEKRSESSPEETGKKGPGKAVEPQNETAQ